MVAEEMPVTATHQSLGPANNSPMLAEDPNEPRFVVMANRLDAPDFSCALHLSGDGGRRWSPASPLPHLPPGAEKCYAPEVAFDRNGVLYYLFVGLAGRGNEPMGVFLASSSDRGRSFSVPRQILGPLNFSVRMSIDRDLGAAGRIHLVWIKATADPPLGGFSPTSNPILAAWSDDGGRNFSEPVQVNDHFRSRVVAPALALGANGAVHVAYYDLRDDAVDYQGLQGPVWEENWSLVLATSTDKGKTFGRGQSVDEDIVPPERVMLVFTMAPPALAVRGDRLCIAWPDARHGDPDVIARCSQGPGRTWSPPVRVNDDKPGNGVSQLLPRLAFAPDGRLDALFYDRRVVPGNFVNNAFFTYSADGGTTWKPNTRLTRYGSDSRVGQQYTNPAAEGMVEFGSRLGLLARDGSVLAAWADTRNSRPDTTTQDIFTTVVSVPTSNRTTSRPIIMWSAPVALGGALGLLAVRRKRRRAAARGEGAG